MKLLIKLTLTLGFLQCFREMRSSHSVYTSKELQFQIFIFLSKMPVLLSLNSIQIFQAAVSKTPHQDAKPSEAFLYNTFYTAPSLLYSTAFMFLQYDCWLINGLLSRLLSHRTHTLPCKCLLNKTVSENETNCIKSHKAITLHTIKMTFHTHSDINFHLKIHTQEI